MPAWSIEKRLVTTMTLAFHLTTIYRVDAFNRSLVWRKMLELLHRVVSAEYVRVDLDGRKWPHDVGDKDFSLPLTRHHPFLFRIHPSFHLFSSLFSSCVCGGKSEKHLTISCFVDTRIAPVYRADGRSRPIQKSGRVSSDFYLVCQVVPRSLNCWPAVCYSCCCS